MSVEWLLAANEVLLIAVAFGLGLWLGRGLRNEVTRSRRELAVREAMAGAYRQGFNDGCSQRFRRF